MPPLPTLWDPAGAVDKLPQPFRMIDKILADIVEQVVDLIGKREQQRKLEEAAKVNLTFAPHAVMEVPSETAAFVPIGVAGIAAAALPDGELRVLSARDAGISFSDRTHTSPVTALEAGTIVSTSGRLLAAASRTTLSLHELDIKTCEMTRLATLSLPQDPDDPCDPTSLHWSPSLGHLAVCFGSGALLLYAVRLPVANVSMNSGAPFMGLNLGAFGSTRLDEVLRMPMAAVRAFCLGAHTVGRSHIMWQLQQRPDKNPHSDRYHKSARGAYIWWEGSGRLLLVDLAAAAAAARPHPADTADAAPSAARPPPAKTVTKSHFNKTGASPAAAAAAAGGVEISQGPVTVAAPPSGEPAGPPRLPLVAPLSRDWLLPHHITAAAATADHKTLAWGLADGSVVLWDDRSCCAVKVLPRLKGAITALGWVNGVAHKLMCASAEGHIFIADIVKPEDSSQKVYEFPQPIHEIHFLPNEPFALCICRGHTSSDGELAASVSGGGASSSGGAWGRASIGGAAGGGAASILRTPALRPRVIWFNVLEEKPVAELMGPQAGQSFGLACRVPPPPLPPPPPRPDEPEQQDKQRASGSGDAKAPAARAKSPETEPPPPPAAAAAAAAGTPAAASASVGARQGMLAALAAMGANVALGPQVVPVQLTVPPGEVVVYPALAFHDTYLLVGGDVVEKVVRSNFADDEGEGPKRVALLYMYKVDALLRHLLPEDEMHSRLGRVVLDRLLADLEAPKVNKKKAGKRVTLDVEDPDTPKLPSSMRKPDPFDAAAGGSRPPSRAANRHITFGSRLEELFDDSGGGTAKKFPKETKVFPKETKKGLKSAPDDMMNKDRRGPDGKPRLAPLGLEKAKEDPPPFSERSQSPPWHHTNPLARIHPDWEEAPVLIRIMERIGSRGGGRKRRDKRLETLTNEMMSKYAKEAGVKPNLLVT